MTTAKLLRCLLGLAVDRAIKMGTGFRVLMVPTVLEEDVSEGRRAAARGPRGPGPARSRDQSVRRASRPRPRQEKPSRPIPSRKATRDAPRATSGVPCNEGRTAQATRAALGQGRALTTPLGQPDAPPEPCGVLARSPGDNVGRGLAGQAMADQMMKWIAGTPSTPAFCITVFRSSPAAQARALATSATLNRITRSFGSSALR